MDSDLLFSHPDPVMLSDFCQNHDEDFEKSFFADNALDTMCDAGFSDPGFFKPLCYTESNHGSSFGKLQSEEKLAELASDNQKGLSSVQGVAVEEPCSFTEELFDVDNYDKQPVDLKHTGIDPYILTDDLSRLVSSRKPDSSVESPGAAVAANALNCLSLEQLRQQSGLGFETRGNDTIACIEEKPYYSALMPDFSSQICRNVSFPSSASDSTAFQVRTQHPSLSLIPEYPESLSSSSLASIVHASSPSSTSISPRIAEIDTQLSIGTDTGGTMFLCQEMQSGFKHMQPILDKRVSSSAASGADENFASEADSNGNCFITLACNPPYDLQSRMIQRSVSSHSLGQLRTLDLSPKSKSVLYFATPQSDANTMLSSGLENFNPLEFEDRASMSTLRRVYSAGDIQNFGGQQNVSCAMNSFGSDVRNRERRFKIGRYTIEERQSRIHRYRQKRTERNFHKKIKYACRKTLADSRPRVRGRFARNDEGSELHETISHAEYDEDDEADAALDEKETSVASQNMSHIFKMPILKAEHRHRSSFWNFSAAAIQTSSLSLT